MQGRTLPTAQAHPHARRRAGPASNELLPLPPWIGVFTAAARDSEYWQKEVRRPAIEFIARRICGSVGSSAVVPMDAAGALEHAVTVVGGDPSSNAGSGERRKRTRGGNSEACLEKTARVPPSTRPPTTHPKRERPEGVFKTERNGLDICSNYAERGPCASGRVHCCHICLGPHTDAGCPDNRKGKCILTGKRSASK